MMMKSMSSKGGVLLIMAMMAVIMICTAAVNVMADPCPVGYRGTMPNCISLASLVAGRGPCVASISDTFDYVSLSCPCNGDVTDAANGIGLKLIATPPSSPNNVLTLSTAITSLQGAPGAQYSQIDAVVPIQSFKTGCDYASPAADVDVYRTTVSMKLVQNNGATGVEDALLTINYRVMLTVNRGVQAASGVYVATTVDGEDISAQAKSLVGVASWCLNNPAPVPLACSPKSSIFPALSTATIHFGLVNSALPTFIKSVECVAFDGSSVWSLVNGWSRYANGNGAASVSFTVPPTTACTRVLVTSMVPSLTSSNSFDMQSLSSSIDLLSSSIDMTSPSHSSSPLAVPSQWRSGFSDFVVSADTPTVASNLSFTVTDAESSTGTSDDSSSSNGIYGIKPSQSSFTLFMVSLVTIGIVQLLSSC